MPRESSRRSVQGTGQAAGDLGKLRPQLTVVRAAPRPRSVRRSNTNDTSRCWMPSCRSRSIGAAGLVTGRDESACARPQSHVRLCSSDPAMVLKLRCRTPISAMPRSGIRTLRSPPCEPAGHGSGLSDRPDDRPRQIAREQHDQQDRPRQTCCGGDDRAARGGVRSAARAPTASCLFRRDELVELPPDGISPPPSFVGRGLAACGGRVLVCRGDRAGSSSRGDMKSICLRSTAAHELAARGCRRPAVAGSWPRSGKATWASCHGCRKPLLTGDDEATLASLEVDHESLEPVGDDQHFLGFSGTAFRGAQIRRPKSVSTANAVAITSASSPLATSMRRVRPPRTAQLRCTVLIADNLVPTMNQSVRSLLGSECDR